MKKRLTQTEEFEILKLVLDKFLWLGFAVMAFGLFKMVTETIESGVAYLVAGAAILVLFMVIIVKEYELSK
ncbi:MAG: hypothetical protein QF632_06335 [Candidatus Woesearchaeota archaeon]|jgi:hypothetical protein|nr:hypothetical protein [Candidatus Woesearchaeota archaeon]MDP7457420.1 hypothetical protein [Candidatus Woesearchaeota archaeon]|tara:strand:+ start:571 stop:783 length:213 start_codon:yes stop_codon:yes gene_type:complete